MFFYPSDIFNFHSFGCHLGSQLGCLLQKCDPDRRDQNSHKSRLCFFTQQTFPIFIPLAVTWCPALDPCDKSVILTGAIKIHIKVIYVFFTHQTFSIFIYFSVTWGTSLDPCCKSVILTSAIKIYIKVVYVFFNQHAFFIFIYFAATWCPTLGPCCKSVILTGAIKIHIKVGYVFLPSRHFPFSFLWLSLGVPTWILATKVRS